MIRPRRRVLAVSAALAGLTLGLATPAYAYPPAGWLQHLGTPVPVGRAYPAMTYDPVGQRTLMFGGCTMSPCPYDTWSWNGSAWTQLTPTVSPTYCPSVEMVYDTLRRRVVMTCGYKGLDDVQTWTFDGTTWTDVTPTSGPRPSGRQHYALTYDVVTGNVVLFGGRTNTGSVVNDTWEWTGSAWTLRIPNGAPLSPAPRYGMGFTYDNAAQATLVVGGQSPGGVSQTDTWTYDGIGGTWTLRASTGPPARWETAVSYNGLHNETILFGGVSLATNVVLNDTWAWNGIAWAPRPALPASARYAAGMAYHRAGDQIVLFGGGPASDTWTYGP